VELLWIKKQTVREHPIGKIAERTIYERKTGENTLMEKGLNGYMKIFERGR
jgi:hypothetical protein